MEVLDVKIRKKTIVLFCIDASLFITTAIMFVLGFHSNNLFVVCYLLALLTVIIFIVTCSTLGFKGDSIEPYDDYCLIIINGVKYRLRYYEINEVSLNKSDISFKMENRTLIARNIYKAEYITVKINNYLKREKNKENRFGNNSEF